MDNHEKNEDDFQCSAFEIGDAFSLDGVAARADGGHAVVDGIHGIHSPNPEDEDGQKGEGEVDGEKGTGRISDAGKGFRGTDAGTFQVHHAGHASPRLGEKGDENDDDAQSSQPFGEGTEEEEGNGQVFEMLDDRRSRAGKAGNTFHQAVQRGQIAAQQVGERIEKGYGQPGKDGDGRTFTGRKACIEGRFISIQEIVKPYGNEKGQQEGDDGPAKNQGQCQRDEKHEARIEEKPGQHAFDDEPVHIICSL